MKLPLLAYKCCSVEERDALLRELKEKGVPVWAGSLPETAEAAGIEYRVNRNFLLVEVDMCDSEVLRGADAQGMEVVSSRQEFVQRLVDAVHTAEGCENNGTEGHFPSLPFKLRVSSPEEYEAVQEKLFKRGYKWLFGGQTVYRTPFGKYLYVDTSGFITHGYNYGCFEDHPYPEVEVSVVFPPTPEPTVSFRVKEQSPKTYKFGSRWRLTNTTYEGHEYILAASPNGFSLVDLSTGETWNVITATGSKELDEEQWKELCAQGTFEPIP